jgi:hypothetical protein
VKGGGDEVNGRRTLGTFSFEAWIEAVPRRRWRRSRFGPFILSFSLSPTTDQSLPWD